MLRVYTYHWSHVSTPETPQERLPDDVVRLVRIFLVLLAGTAVLYLFSLPLAFGILVTGPVALGIGLKALLQSWRLPGLVSYRLGMIAGMAMAGFATVFALGLVVVREPVMALEQCLDRAITQQARDTCQADYEQSYRDFLEQFGVTLP